MKTSAVRQSTFGIVRNKQSSEFTTYGVSRNKPNVEL